MTVSSLRRSPQWLGRWRLDLKEKENADTFHQEHAP